MALEIEAKFRLSDPEEMRSRLAAAGAEPAGKVIEDNAFFDTAGAQLLRNDCGLRVRTACDDSGQQHCTLTYKGPRRPGELKVREEAEAVVASAESAKAILTGLGYEPTIAFQKRRESYRLDDARVELDELPQLGFFLEIEADDEPTLQDARAKLGLADQPTVTDTYIALVAELLAGTESKSLAF